MLSTVTLPLMIVRSHQDACHGRPALWCCGSTAATHSVKSLCSKLARAPFPVTLPLMICGFIKTPAMAALLSAALLPLTV